eukprot:m.33999 g.33999  ORF g.33999 m.33999 type:complete len:132 (-) comp5638_c0_seq3:1661-2056(-)
MERPTATPEMRRRKVPADGSGASPATGRRSFHVRKRSLGKVNFDTNVASASDSESSRSNRTRTATRRRRKNRKTFRRCELQSETAADGSAPATALQRSRCTPKICLSQLLVNCCCRPCGIWPHSQLPQHGV